MSSKRPPTRTLDPEFKVAQNVETLVPEEFAGGVYANYARFELNVNDATLDFLQLAPEVKATGRPARITARLVARINLPHTVLRSLSQIISAQVEAFSQQGYEIPNSREVANRLAKKKGAT